MEIKPLDHSPAVSGVATDGHLPVLRPMLPAADRLLPYFRRIDESRIYSNFGPLAQEFEARLGCVLGLGSGFVVSANSGTSALIAAILAGPGRASESRPYALIPAYTFVATAAAAELCGYRPLLSDINARTWTLEPDCLDGGDLQQVGLVIPVAPYGRLIAQGPWLTFRERTGIDVVIDAAACFDGLARTPEGFLGPLPLALSFHATKSFGIGEGGAVVSTDKDYVARSARALNFGFYDLRDCRSPSFNGKLSEYHAAAGLAELDGWTAKQSSYSDVASCYRHYAAEAGLEGRFFLAPEISASYVLFHCGSPEQRAAVQESLRRRKIGCRLWYGLGLHRQSYYANVLHGPLTSTDTIAAALLGLPVAADLRAVEIRRVVQAVAEGVRKAF